jgi:hypothetical protein
MPPKPNFRRGTKRLLSYLLSRTHVVLALSYWKAGALLSVSLVSSRVSHPLSFFFAAVEGNDNLFLPYAQEAADAENETGDFSGLIDENVINVTILLSLGS